jgi:hypothetical protein
VKCQSKVASATDTTFSDFVTDYKTINSAKSSVAFVEFSVSIDFLGGAVTGYIKDLNGKYRAIRGGWPPGPTTLMLNAMGSTRADVDDSVVDSGISLAAFTHDDVPQATRVMATVMTANNLSIPGLMQLGQHVTNEDIQNRALEYLMAAAEYHRGSEEEVLFGPRKAANKTLLTGSGLMDELDSRYKTWLGNNLGKASILRSLLASDDKYAKLLDDAQNDKLTYWWDGNVSVDPAEHRSLLCERSMIW